MYSYILSPYFKAFLNPPNKSVIDLVLPNF
jgi:hypothetical protein